MTGSPDFDATFVENTVTPGEETTLDVVLVNSGTIDSGSSTQGVQNSEVTTARGSMVRSQSGLLSGFSGDEQTGPHLDAFDGRFPSM